MTTPDVPAHETAHETACETADEVTARIELQSAVLVRHFEMLRRRGEVYQGLERSEYLMLRTLDTSGPTDIAGIAARLGLDPSTAGRQITAMTQRGLVARSQAPEDRRRCIIAPTEEGSRLMEQVRRRRHEETGALLASWDADDRATFADVLTRYNQTVAARYL